MNTPGGWEAGEVVGEGGSVLSGGDSNICECSEKFD